MWSDENPYASVESNSQQRYNVIVWFAGLDDQLLGPFIFEGYLTGQVYLCLLQEELPEVLYNVLFSKQRLSCRRGVPTMSARRIARRFREYAFE
jgi:hypothetical protein